MLKRILKRGDSKLTDRFATEKIFCIGANKTGTTSLEQALKDLGYRLGNQVTGEMLLKPYGQRNFQPIIEHAFTADAFQDAPFSYPYTFVLLDHYFPNAKFILTIRDSSEQWYDSLTGFHAKLFGNGVLPTREVLENATHIYKGRPWEANRILFNTPPDEPYHKPTLINYYESHNKNVVEYFRTKNNLLVLNVAEKGAYRKFCSFLGKASSLEDFPWLNKT